MHLAGIFVATSDVAPVREWLHARPARASGSRPNCHPKKCQLNRVKIPGLRLPLSRQPLGVGEPVRPLPLVLAVLLLCLFSQGCNDEENLLAGEGVAIRTILVFDSERKPLWKVSAVLPHPLGTAQYGVVPVNFAQEIPVNGSHPRLLVSGEKISVVVIGSERAFRREGQATGPARFRGGFWESAPLRDRSVEERALAGGRLTGSL